MMNNNTDNLECDKHVQNRHAINLKQHWEAIYSNKESTELSWYQQHPERSLELIKATGVDVSAAIIDIGGGASTLVDCLLTAGYENLSVLDIAHGAIEQAKARLARSMTECANKVEWIEQDIIKFVAEEPFDVWHDRAVFHFLTGADDRFSYVETMLNALKPGGHAIIASFDLAGPEKCSGLDIVRYSSETMSAALGDNFQLIETRIEEHKTPAGSSQSFLYCRFKRVL